MLLDARRATPGLRLEMQQLRQTKDSAEPRYQLQAFGFPKGVKLLLWSKEFDHSIHQMAFVFQVDKSGNVVSSNRGWRRQAETLGRNGLRSRALSPWCALGGGPGLGRPKTSSLCESRFLIRLPLVMASARFPWNSSLIAVKNSWPRAPAFFLEMR